MAAPTGTLGSACPERSRRVPRGFGDRTPVRYRTSASIRRAPPRRVECEALTEHAAEECGFVRGVPQLEIDRAAGEEAQGDAGASAADAQPADGLVMAAIQRIGQAEERGELAHHLRLLSGEIREPDMARLRRAAAVVPRDPRHERPLAVG